VRHAVAEGFVRGATTSWESSACRDRLNVTLGDHDHYAAMHGHMRWWHGQTYLLYMVAASADCNSSSRQ
jgi:hypothetical protein